ncbi:MAG: DUF4157 domain-containing protein, partial [Geminicoccaceae bacterium]
MKPASAALPRRELAAGEPLLGDPGGGGSGTGMPGDLRAGLEELSGLDLSTVRVHRNSAGPARIDALAYTHGTDIHLAPGQEKHLPHEGWHAVQQMQGRVRPTTQTKGISINHDHALENEAEVMGARAGRLLPEAGATCCHACAATVDGGHRDEPHRGIPPPGNAYGVTGQRVATRMTTGEIPVLQRATSFTPRSCREVGGNWLRWRRFRSARSRRNPRHEGSYARLGICAIA